MDLTRKKGISGIIEAVIMITIMLSVMGIVFTYISGTYLGITEENKKIEVVDILDENRVLIKNAGLATVEIPGDLEVFVEGEAVDLDEYGGLIIRSDDGLMIKKMSGDVIQVG